MWGLKRSFTGYIRQLQEKGTTILLYSSDEQELLDLCERVLVMQDETIKADLSEKELTESNWFTSAWVRQTIKTTTR